MPKFECGNTIRANYTKSNHFTRRDIIGVDIDHGVYVTRFTEDLSIVDSSINVVDSLYCLEGEGL